MDAKKAPPFVGVIGGMGPLATADFLTKLVKSTAAKCDQEHIPVLVDGDCTIPAHYHQSNYSSPLVHSRLLGLPGGGDLERYFPSSLDSSKSGNGVILQ